MKKLNKRLLVTIIALVLCAATLSTSIGVTLAKYSSYEEKDEVITPSRFYFESNLLTEAGVSYTLGINEIRFELRAFADTLRVSEVDVTYETSITTTDAAGNTVVPSVSSTNSSGTLMKWPGGDAELPSVTVAYRGLEFGKTYTVTASATAPYTKTISATFRLADKKDSLSFLVEDAGDVVYMTVQTNELESTVNIYWQEGYVPYNADPALATAVGTSAVGVTLTPMSSFKFRFFKRDLSAEFSPLDFYIESFEPINPDDSIDSEVTDSTEGGWN